MPVQRNPALGSCWSGAASGASLLQGASGGTGTEPGRCTLPRVCPGGDKVHTQSSKLMPLLKLRVESHSAETW